MRGFLADDKAVEAGVGEVCRHGLLRLVGAPVDPGTVEAVVARFGFIRETNYCRVFDVRVIPDPNHRAMGRVEMEGARAAAWYGAYLRFAKAAAAAERHLSLPMKPGDLVLFDNERILHGRDAFSVTSERWLRGCYADRDGLLASLARLRGATT